MKVCVDQEKCIGCGACVAIDPENFDFNDEGLSSVINEEPSETAQDAVEACPVFAISIEKDGECKCNEECECGDDCKCSEDEKCSEGCNCGDECKCGDNCECGDECPCHDDEEVEEAA